MLNPFNKHPELILHGSSPLNAEPPAAKLRSSFVTPQDLLYIRSHGDIPKLDAATHRIAVTGHVGRSLDLSLADIKTRFAPRTVRAVMQCAGNRRADMRAVRPVKGDPWAGGAIGCADWTGASLADVLDAVGAETRNDLHVAFTSADTCQASDGGAHYGVSIPMAKALQHDVLVAYAINGEPLAAEHGFPLRIVAPGYAGGAQPEVAEFDHDPGCAIRRPSAGGRLQALSAGHAGRHRGPVARHHHRRHAAELVHLGARVR